MEILERAKELLLEYGLNIVWALVIFFIGRWIVNLVVKLISKGMKKSKTDETVIGFAGKLIGFAGMIFVIIAAFQKLGVPTASMIAAVGAIGLAIGLSLQGALGNFAAGILIVVFRPFKVGDLVVVAGEVGTVREIELFTTKIITPENKTVIIPNGMLTSDKIVNITETENLRVDLTFGTAYEDDIDQVKKVIMDVIKADNRVLTNPAPFVGVVSHGDSSVNYAVRPWVKAENYWGVYFDMHENIKKAFDKEGISIPFPQSDVHIIKETTDAEVKQPTQVSKTEVKLDSGAGEG